MRPRAGTAAAKGGGMLSWKSRYVVGPADSGPDLRSPAELPRMKKFLLLAALAGVALTGPVFATAIVPAPVPVKVVNPTGLPPQFAGADIRIQFKLDAAGQPRDIQVLSVQDR